MRTVTLTESAAERVHLTATEAVALQEMGRRLSSDRRWWGSDGGPIERTVVQCQRLSGDEWHVTIHNAVGMIVIGQTLQINVTSKIPESHLLYLFSQSDVFPRLDDGRGRGGASASLWEVIGEWFVRSTERVLRQELIKDYEACVEEAMTARGRVSALETAAAYYAGRVGCVCEFDEFAVDTSLNRVLKAAAATVLMSPTVSRQVRQRARSLLLRMSDVGHLRPADLLSRLDRRTAHYAAAHLLAHHVLRGVGRDLSAGGVPVWTFLVRTPELVEASLRNVIQRALPEHAVVKQGLRLPQTTMTLNPDLVFDARLAVADVKYKLAGDEWKRGDLYQVVTFATGYRVVDAAIIDFMPAHTSPLPDLRVGDVAVRHLAWSADGKLVPEEAAESLVKAVRIWLAVAKGRGDDDLKPSWSSKETA